MSRSDLLARLEQLKKKTPEQPKAAQPKAEQSTVAASVKDVVKAAENKVVVQSTTEATTPAEIHKIIADTSLLSLNDDARSISGFNADAFEYRLNEINLLQEQTFPEINRAIIEINRDLRQHPELAHLLSPEQVAVIVRRILHEKHLYIAPVKEKKEKKITKGKALGKVFDPEVEALLQNATIADDIDASDL